jgi:prepilin peptidase CpaA
MNIVHFVPVLAVVVTASAAVTDCRRRRIPNRLTYPAILTGFLVQALFDGWHGVLFSIGGMLAFGGAFMLFYIVRAMGAGDVKLAGALGSIVGYSAAWPLMLATALAGAALAIVFMVLSGRIAETLRNTLWVAGFHLRHGLRAHPHVNLDNPKGVRMPYGLAFAGGTLYWAVSLGFWR